MKARFVSRVKGPDRIQRLSKTELFNLAYDLAENMYISRRIKNENKSAGKNFYTSSWAGISGHVCEMQNPQVWWEKLPSKATNIPQPAGVKNAEDAVTDIHIPSISSDHHTANIWQIYAANITTS